MWSAAIECSGNTRLSPLFVFASISSIVAWFYYMSSGETSLFPPSVSCIFYKVLCFVGGNWRSSSQQEQQTATLKHPNMPGLVSLLFARKWHFFLFTWKIICKILCCIKHYLKLILEIIFSTGMCLMRSEKKAWIILRIQLETRRPSGYSCYASSKSAPWAHG